VLPVSPRQQPLLARSRADQRSASNVQVATLIRVEGRQMVERQLQNIKVDLSHSSMRKTAIIMRHLCELDGMIDYLAWGPAEATSAIFSFVQVAGHLSRLMRQMW